LDQVDIAPVDWAIPPIKDRAAAARAMAHTRG
jgi:hypothetical protein